MGAMVVEVGPEIQQFILEICTRPEQHVIQIFASNGANEPFHEGMRLGNVGDGLDGFRTNPLMARTISCPR
jgi:hypothetical protein